MYCVRFLFKKAGKLTAGIELEAGYFSLDNWTKSIWRASPPLFSHCSLIPSFTTIAVKDNSVEIHQMSDSTEILHQNTAIVLVPHKVLF